MLAQFYQLTKELIDIRHVEVPCNDQLSRWPVVLTQKWVASFNRVPSVGAVTQVT